MGFTQVIPVWSEERVAEVAKLIRKYSYREVGAKLGVSKGAISSIVRRHIYKIPDPRVGKH